MSKIKLIIMAFIIILTLVCMNGCKKNLDTLSKKSQKTVIDQNGKEVVVPEKIDRIALTALPLPSAYALTGEPIEKIVGMHPGSKGAIANSIMGKMYPGLLNADTSFIEGTDLNIEQLLKLAPDLVIYWGDYRNQTEQLEKAGIPAIGVKTQGDGDALYTLETWLDIMGKVFGREAEIKKIIKYGKEISDEVSEKTKEIKSERRVKSLILFQHSEKDITVPGKGHYGQVWIEKTGGINIANEINSTASVNMEQIYAWDPEILFITSFTDTMPEDLYENKIKGQDWSKVKAVKNKKVYKIPVGVYRWYPPSGDAPLMMKWMAVHQYPDFFSYNMEKAVIEYYKEFYNYEISLDEANAILHPVRDTAEGAKGQFTGGGQRR